MKKSDHATLLEMRKEIDNHLTHDLGKLVEKLLRLRDKLTFDDASWYDNFTQHLVTLDSASTFHPRSKAEEIQLEKAIKHAFNQINLLIRLI